MQKKWKELISNNDNTYFFHSPLWAKIIEKSFDEYNTNTRIYHINGNEILVPMMKKNQYGFKFLYSMPFGSYGGFFSKSSISSNDIKNVINKIIGGRNLNFNFTIPPLSNLPLDFAKNPKVIEVNKIWSYTHILSVDKDFEYIWKNKFNRRARRSIKKAQKHNITIREGDSLDDFKAYHDIYAKAIKKWDMKNPPDPFDFYKNMYKYGSDYVNLYLAILNDEIIAGLLTFNYGKTVFMYGSAFLNEYGSFHPTSLIYGHIIKNACNESYKYVNMGSSGDISGVRKFKENFGSETIKTNSFSACSLIGRLGSKLYGAISDSI